MKNLNFLFLNAFLVLLSGCAALKPVIPDSEVQFSLRAKVGVRTQNGGFSANMRWIQYETRYHISLWGPLGQGLTEIEGANGLIRISDPKGQLLEGGNAEEMMRSRLGWSMPLDVLQYWVQGLPGSNHPVDEAIFDNKDRLIQLRQLNWLIRFNWRDDAATLDFPYKLVAEREASKITLVIKESLRHSR